MRDDARQGDPSMHAKAIEGLSDRVIFAKARFTLKARAAGRTSKLTDWQGKTVDDGRTGVVRQEAIANQAPDTLFDGPQIGRLPSSTVGKTSSI